MTVSWAEDGILGPAYWGCAPVRTRVNEIHPGLSLDEAHMDIPPMATLASVVNGIFVVNEECSGAAGRRRV